MKIITSDTCKKVLSFPDGRKYAFYFDKNGKELKPTVAQRIARDNKN